MPAADHDERLREAKELDAERAYQRLRKKVAERRRKGKDCFHFFFDCNCDTEDNKA